MTTKVVNLRNPTTPFDVYIGRPTVWGNPYSHKPGTLAKYLAKDRETSVRLFMEYATARAELHPDWLEPLRGKVLGCFCKPLACHGDVIAEILDR